MAQIKKSATAQAIPSAAATAPKAKTSKVKGSAMEATTAGTTPARKGIPAAAIVIEIDSSPDYSADRARGSGWQKVRKQSAPSCVLDDEIQMWTPRQKRRLDEECKILSEDPLAAAELAPVAAAPAAGDDEDIVVVAERGKVACRDFPHLRFACAKNPFNRTPHERHCDKCFCYVCDIAAPCAFWMGPEGHCHAWDKDRKWNAMRSSHQKRKKL